MANYKTTDEIIDVIYSLLGAITVNKYKKEKPTEAEDTEYVVINTLPIDGNIMQKCYVNVNYHVADKGPGMPDHVKIDAGSVAVLNILQKVSTTAYLIDFESQETMKELGKDEHFSNLRFSVKYVNN